MVRRIGYTVAALVAGVLVVWLSWHPGSENPAVAIDRVGTTALVLVLAALPWLTRPLLGPVAPHRTARVVRAAGYLAIYAVLAVIVGLSRYSGSRFDHFQAFDPDNWAADMRSGAVMGAILYTVLFGAYATAVLAATSRRLAVPPAALAAGTAIGAAGAAALFALTPFGSPLHVNGWLVVPYGIALVAVAPLALLAAGAVAVRRTPVPMAVAVDPAAAEIARLRTGATAGICAAAMGALVLSTLTVTAMLAQPHRVDLKWANPDPAVPHGTPFELQMSVSDTAAKYLAALLLAPLIGLVLGAIGGVITRSPLTPTSHSTPTRTRTTEPLPG